MRLALLSALILSLPCSAQIFGSTSGYAGTGSQTNDPVSMVFEHKQTQTLADGTHISTARHEYFYRDNLGRTRTEQEVGMPWMANGTSMRSVTVNDPVARTMTTWQTGAPEGTLHQYTRFDQNPPQRPLMMPADSSQSHTVVPVRPQAQSNRPRPETTTEKLGTQDVQGIPCEATRMTVVYPVNFMGNDRPIVTVSERCMSREFGRALTDVTIDPRTGDRSTTLQSISRGEPAASLFQPPPDYVDSKAPKR